MTHNLLQRQCLLLEMINDTLRSLLDGLDLK